MNKKDLDFRIELLWNKLKELQKELKELIALRNSL